MPRFVRFHSLVLLWSCMVAMNDGPLAHAQDIEPAVRNRIERAIEQVRSGWVVPGMAVAIVHDGSVVFAEGFGVSDIASRQRVTPKTAFAIGSATKPITALAAGILMRERGFNWEDPIGDHWVEFGVSSQAHTAQVLIGDILSHSSGVSDSNLIWYGSGFDRETVIEQISRLQISVPVRTRFIYNNMMYIAAGHLIERWSGERYETFLHDQLFSLLGMHDTIASPAEVDRLRVDFAKPYTLLDNEPAEIQFRDLTNAAPAGGVISTAGDMARLVNVLLDPSRAGSDAPFDSALIARLTTPRIVIEPAGPPLQIDTQVTPMITYGLGWFVASHRGRRVVFHPGGFDGMSATIALVPELDLGIVVLSNLDSNFGVLAIQSEIIDAFLGLESIDWSNLYRDALSPGFAALDQFRNPVAPAFSLQGLPLENGVPGTYKHEYLGSFRITLHEDKLVAIWGEFEAVLEPVAAGVFRLLPIGQFSIAMPLVAQFAQSEHGSVEASFFGKQGWLRMSEEPR